MIKDKFRNTLVVTIADESGSRQFRITKFIKKAVIFGAILLFALVIVGYFSMKYVVDKLDSINDSKKKALVDYIKVHSQNLTLQNDINNKTFQLKLVNDKINDLESVVSMKHVDNVKKDSIDLKKLSMIQKTTMLQIFPNGNPILHFDSKNKTSHNIAKDRALDENAVGNATNTGYDYFVAQKEPVVATADGIVEFVRRNYRGGYGNIVRLVHSLGFSTGYAHLSDIKVKKGDFVTKGDIIGYSTPSAESNNISLYYEVRFLSVGLDTLSFINWSNDNFGSIFESSENAIVDFNNLIWAMNDIVKLKEMSATYSGKK